MCRHIRRDDIKNKDIHDKVRMTQWWTIWERRGWDHSYEHVKRKYANAMMKCDVLTIISTRKGRNSLAMSWKWMIRHDIVTTYRGHDLKYKDMEVGDQNRKLVDSQTLFHFLIGFVIIIHTLPCPSILLLLPLSHFIWYLFFLVHP